MGLLEPGRSDGADRPDIIDVRADDALLDALGRRASSAPGRHRAADPGSRTGHGSEAVRERLFDHPEDRRLLDLFITWRSGLDREPAPAAPCADRAAAVISASARRRSLRSMLGVAAAICVLLVGSAAIGSRTAHPGDVLWPVTQALWSDRADSVVAGNTARQALGQARTALDAGMTSEARSQLAIVSTALPRVAERDGHRVIEADMDNLLSTLDWIQQQQQTTPTSAAPVPGIPPEAGSAALITSGGPVLRAAAPGSSVPIQPSSDPTRSAASSGPATARSTASSAPPSSASSESTTPSGPAGPATSPPSPVGSPVGQAPPTATSAPPSSPTAVPTPASPQTSLTPPTTATSPAPSAGSTVAQTTAPTSTSATQQVVPVVPTASATETTSASPGSTPGSSSAQQEEAVATVATTAD